MLAFMLRRYNLTDSPSGHANNFHLSFSIGPVQAFVAQARRTRDLWCGSWLLSYLAESALVAIENEFINAKAIIPDRSDNCGQLTSVENATGGIPNRFEVTFDSREEAVAAGNRAAKSFHTAWEKKIAEAVRTLMEPAFKHGNQSEDIWNRQVENFWEVSWIVAQPKTDQSTIGEFAAARKLFRNVKPSEEAGVKCSLMPQWQELSGYDRSDEQKLFWRAVRKLEGIGGLDIGENERLSAIALIKRLFPKTDQKVLGQSLQQKHWPSTAFFAATPWLKEIQREQNGSALEAARTYINAAKNAGVHLSEFEAAKDAGIAWAAVDGPAWSTAAIRNNEWGIADNHQKQLLQSLRELYELMNGKKPVPFYALLLMDGDSMGKLLGALGGDPSKLSRCLGTFTSAVDRLVASPEFNGRTIYAGGDDVMAMLPAIHALPAAAKLEQNYQQAFAETLKEKASAATISAAIVYAHWKQPLRQVLELAHHLLDDVAKKQTGRDSLAVGIMKGSGLNAQWSAPWEFVRKQKLIDLNDSIIHQFTKDEKTKLPSGESFPSFNASFLYHLRNHYSRLVGHTLDQPGSFVRFDESTNGQDDMFLALANAEYRRRLSRDQQTSKDVDTTWEQVVPLIELSRQAVRQDGELKVDNNTFGFDGWRIARFLKQVHDGEVQDDE